MVRKCKQWKRLSGWSLKPHAVLNVAALEISIPPACEVDSQHACREVVSPLHHLRLMRIISSAFWHYIRKSLIVNNCSEAVRWYIYFMIAGCSKATVVTTYERIRILIILEDPEPGLFSDSTSIRTRIRQHSLQIFLASIIMQEEKESCFRKMI